jgi:hypothetical protein
MRALNDKERRTLRWAGIALGIYLGLFYGVDGVKRLEAHRTEYQRLVGQARQLDNELRPYENKLLLIEKLRSNFQLDPTTLSRAAIVADASAAIQAAAQSGGVQIGPIRESPGSVAARELAAMTIEGTGQVRAVMQLIHRVATLGYPLIVESIQITPAQNPPGQVAVVLQIVILDFNRWKPESANRNA